LYCIVLRLTGDYVGAFRYRCRCYYDVRSLMAAICYYCWVRVFVDGMSNSKRSGGFRGWFVIHYLCGWSVIGYLTDGSLSARWLSALPILTGIRI